ncbi:MAG: hypothetical protein ACXQS8_00560 [Candidatus Helarchaeales archaeon]
MLKRTREIFLPNKVVILNPIEQGEPEICDIIEFIKSQPSIEGKVTIYFCKNFSCNRSSMDIDEMVDLLA